MTQYVGTCACFSEEIWSQSEGVRVDRIPLREITLSQSRMISIQWGRIFIEEAEYLLRSILCIQFLQPPSFIMWKLAMFLSEKEICSYVQK